MSSFAKLKKFLWFFAKLAIAGGIVAYLVLRNPEEIAASFRTFNYWWLIPACGIYLGHILVCAWRWHRLTRMLGVRLSGFEAVSLTMQGNFFSLVIPGGAIGGDVVKMGVLSKRSKAGSKVEGAFTILMDRIIGMIALFVLALGLLIPAAPLLMKVELPQLPLTDGMRRVGIFALAGLCLAGLGASCVIFFHRRIEKLPLFGDLMHWGDRITHGMVSRMTAATDIYAKQWKELTLLVIVSILFVHLMTVAAFACIMGGLEITVPALTLITAVTIGNIAGLIPLCPGGIGGRDLVIITILAAGSIAVGDAKTGQLLYTATVLFFNLLGGVFFLFDPGRRQTEETLKKELESTHE
ncbi:lysylphosphatidylglycerol synthase transmembrane domain-containing protein [uncultured Victivallis sp.]|uniref:lysylphosphatidylglycerol synthase transmembrane domain-containing protein n=1 Tax=uncultured Victivallis sp. TaxID=354118 RepID=UPI0026011E5A|nr:lysylphosphatidylglycerol synthase transmembrane domain-containing protein [uncultured Victivallis sp.]